MLLLFYAWLVAELFASGKLSGRSLLFSELKVQASLRCISVRSFHSLRNHWYFLFKILGRPISSFGKIKKISFFSEEVIHTTSIHLHQIGSVANITLSYTPSKLLEYLNVNIFSHVCFLTYPYLNPFSRQS